MNERIRELAEQAGEYAAQNATGDWEVGPDYQDLFNKKFAELIVRECVKLQYKNVVVGGVSDYNRGRRELTEDIQKHFGVEE